MLWIRRLAGFGTCAGFPYSLPSIDTLREDTIISIWDIDHPEAELYTLQVRGKLAAMSMSSVVSMVVAGTDNGAISIFDTRESEDYHRSSDKSKTDMRMRSSSAYTGILRNCVNFNYLLTSTLFIHILFDLTILLGPGINLPTSYI